jgi:hypothetical protein
VPLAEEGDVIAFMVIVLPMFVLTDNAAGFFVPAV